MIEIWTAPRKAFAGTLSQVFLRHFLSSIVALRLYTILLSFHRKLSLKYLTKRGRVIQPILHSDVVATREKKCPQEPSAPVPQYNDENNWPFFLDGV